jgi:hypothetical protein
MTWDDMAMFHQIGDSRSFLPGEKIPAVFVGMESPPIVLSCPGVII